MIGRPEVLDALLVQAVEPVRHLEERDAETPGIDLLGRLGNSKPFEGLVEAARQRLDVHDYGDLPGRAGTVGFGGGAGNVHVFPGGHGGSLSDGRSSRPDDAPT
jgi:hypothetical protein